MTLTIALSIALSGVIAVSAWAINNTLDERRDVQNVVKVALAYRDYMSASRCTVPTTPLTLGAARGALASAGKTFAAVEDETSWRMTFDGGNDRQTAVTVFKVDSVSNIVRSHTLTLPVAGGDRSHEFFDAVFASRICP